MLVRILVLILILLILMLFTSELKLALIVCDSMFKTFLTMFLNNLFLKSVDVTGFRSNYVLIM